jgi:hypothetical protein
MEGITMGKELIEENGNDKELMKKRWKNRRRMAWVSLSSMVLITTAILFTDMVSIEKLKVLSEVITWFYFSCASVIGAYMGFTTYASIKGK